MVFPAINYRSFTSRVSFVFKISTPIQRRVMPARRVAPKVSQVGTGRDCGSASMGPQPRKQGRERGLGAVRAAPTER